MLEESYLKWSSLFLKINKEIKMNSFELYFINYMVKNFDVNIITYLCLGFDDNL